MGCKECGKPKCNGKCGCKSPKVLQINNPAEYITFHKVSIPAAMGDSTTNPPRIGAYRNALVYYEADHTSWMYSTDGIPTLVTGEKGETGDVGPQGPAGTIAVGTTTTGEPGTDVEVENVGTPENAILNFTIPRGEQGDQGIQGEPGPQGYMNEQDVRDVVDTIVPEGFFDDEATVSGCGTEFELENLAGGEPVSVRINGDTFQQTYTGKNLFNFVSAGTDQGLTATYDTATGIISVTGTAASNYSNISIPVDLALEAGQTFTSSIDRELPVRMVTRATYTDNTASSFNIEPGQTSVTWSAVKQVQHIRLYISLSVPGDSYDLSFKFQLVAGSTPDYDFEPYVGGTAAPNPDYPQQIQTVTGEQTVTVMGKNLANPTPVPGGSNGVVATYNSQTGVVTVSGIAQTTWSNPFKVANSIYLPAGTYTLKQYGELTNGLISCYARGVGHQVDASTLQNTFTTNSDGNAYICITSLTSGNSVSGTIKIQLEAGSTATQFVPYSKQTYPLDLGSLELCKIGTYQDYIWKDGDDWKVHKATVSAIIDGSEDWSASGTNTLYVANIYSKIGNSIQSTSTGEMYASHFTIVDILSSNTLVGASLKVDAAHNLSNLRIRLQDMSGGTAGFRQMLSAKKPSIYARRLTPTDTTITDTNLIAQLEAIRLDTGVNAISVSSDGLSGEICLEAYRDNWKGTISELRRHLPS